MAPQKDLCIKLVSQRDYCKILNVIIRRNHDTARNFACSYISSWGQAIVTGILLRSKRLYHKTTVHATVYQEKKLF